MKTEKELVSIITAYEKTAIGGYTGELAQDREDALDRYYGRLYGNEMDGRSKVVSKDVSDAVDWIMPSMLRVFMSSDSVVRFDPVGPEDTEAAEQESDYVNHVLMKENNGFLVLHDWFKDALLLRNGYVKRWWDETEEVSQETYTGLAPEEAALLMQSLEQSGDEVEIVGQEVIPAADGERYNIKLKITRKVGKVCIMPVPPEEILVSNRARADLQEANFVQHVTKKTRSELVEMGLPKAWVDDLPSWKSDGPESIARSGTDDEVLLEEALDAATQEVEYRETFIRIDADEDGIAELRRIVVIGSKIPEGEEWNQEIDSIPISYLTPNRMPHRHVGLGVYDELKELAEIKTALLRGTLDNTYQLINSEWMVNERVNLSDFLQSRPNGVKRIQGKEPIGDAASPVMKPSIIQHVIPVLDYVDSIKESRTGVGRNLMGLDADTLKKTTEGAARQALQQANAKVEMIARVFAETGVKDLALAIHALLLKHQNKAKVVQIRNKWVSVNPQEWKKRTDMSVAVGLGTGSQDEIRANMLMLADLQERAAQAGVVLPKNVYNLANKAAQALGFKQEGEFFTDPDSEEFKAMQQQQSQQQPNPLAEVEQIKGQFKMQADQLKAQTDHQHKMHMMEFEKWKFEQQHALDIAKAEIEAAKNAVPADLGQPGMGTETKGINISFDDMRTVATNVEQSGQNIQATLGALLQQNQQLIQAMSEGMNRPINIVRDKAGRVAGATRG